MFSWSGELRGCIHLPFVEIEIGGLWEVIEWAWAEGPWAAERWKPNPDCGWVGAETFKMKDSEGLVATLPMWLVGADLQTVKILFNFFCSIYANIRA